MTDTGKKIVVGMSGGVDSSVAAALLVEQGHDVVGLFMKNWEETDEPAYCTASEDAGDAIKVCDRLGIPLELVNFADEYWNRVFTGFLKEYRDGRTPNPDILCNREIKFGEFRRHAARLGADMIATGHYARLRPGEHGPKLLRGVDRSKDQSYFLHAVDREDFRNVVFPLGELTKAEVRRRAGDLGFENRDKKDSTGICFIGERRFRQFLQNYLAPDPGPMIDVNGNRVGTHDGLMYYTIGQRHGLGIGGPGEPWYVAAKDTAGNTLTVVQGHDHPALMSDTVVARPAHWIGHPPPGGSTVSAQTRYRQADAPCRIDYAGDAVVAGFDRPQRAVTPGQYIVFYDGEVCLGGAVIERSLDQRTVDHGQRMAGNR